MSTKIINSEMLRFKEASRHLWNTFMAPADGRASLQSLLAFEKIERELLRIIVLEPHGLADVANSYRFVPLTAICIRPKHFLTEMPIQSGESEENGNTRWQTSRTVQVGVHSVFEFFDFFDWNAYEHRDFSYIRAVSKEDGKPVLIEHAHSDFFLIN